MMGNTVYTLSFIHLIITIDSLMRSVKMAEKTKTKTFELI